MGVALDGNGQVMIGVFGDGGGGSPVVPGAVPGNAPVFGAGGQIMDSGKALDGLADKDAQATAGNVAKFDSEGNPVDSNIPASNVAQQDGYYGAKGLGAATAENLIDIHATGIPRMFTLDTAAGEASIAGDGNGRIEEIRGVTNTFNQMVAADNINTVTGTGVVQVTDCVAGNVTALEVSGRTYARNQRVSNGNFVDTTGWSFYLFSLSAANNVLTGTLTREAGGSSSMSVVQYIPTPILSGRSAMIRFDIKCPYTGTVTVRFRSEVQGATWGGMSTTYAAANTWQTINFKWTGLEADVRGFLIYPATSGYDSWSQGDTFQLRNVMLCDLTQCFGGDATAIAAVSTWADLVARIPEYGSYVATDAGTLVSRGGTVEVLGEEHAYGIIYDPSQGSPACQKVEYANGTISNVESFTEMPCHNLRRCVMDDLANRHVNYWLDAEDSTKKADGTASVLTGADGDVMVHLPKSYWRCDGNYNGTGKYLWLMSDQPFRDSQLHPFFYVSPDGGTPRGQYVGAYKASICGPDGVPLNTTEGATSQDSGTSSTRLARSVAGALPWVSMTLADLRTAAVRHGGTGVNSLFHQWLILLMATEQGTLNTQSISAGYTNGKVYGVWTLRKSGRANFGNGTGEIFATGQDEDNFISFKIGDATYYRDSLRDADGRYAWSTNHVAAAVFTASATPSNGDTAYESSTGDTAAGTVASYSAVASGSRVVQFQYRGIENPFGEVWEFEDGIQKYIVDANDQGYWWTAKTADYTSTAQQGASSPAYWRTRHPWPTTGYVKAFDPRTFLPLVTGGGANASTYLCDYFYNDGAAGSRVVARGGSAGYGSRAGMGYVYVRNGLAGSSVAHGGRLSA